jgi:hypothetical protein
LQTLFVQPLSHGGRRSERSGRNQYDSKKVAQYSSWFYSNFHIPLI